MRQGSLHDDTLAHVLEQSVHCTAGESWLPSHVAEMYCPGSELAIPARQLLLHGAHVVSV